MDECLEQIWIEACKSDRQDPNSDGMVIRRGVKIWKSGESIQVGKYCSDDLVLLDLPEVNMIKDEGWRVGTTKIGLEQVIRDIDRLNNRIREEVNNKKNNKFVKSLTIRRAEKLKVYSKMVADLRKTQS